MAAIDDLQDKLLQVHSITEALAEKRQLLENYKTTRQTYAQLVTDTKAELDQLTTDSQTALKELRDAINAAFPPP
jgi:phosphoglycerate-specific signal transduction histidine kinase